MAITATMDAVNLIMIKPPEDGSAIVHRIKRTATEAFLSFGEKIFDEGVVCTRMGRYGLNKSYHAQVNR